MQSARTAGVAPARPAAITIVCVIGFIIVLVSAAIRLGDIASQADPWYPAYLGVVIATAFGVVWLIGLWMMRKWAVYTYTACAAGSQAILLGIGLWTPMALVIPTIFMLVMFRYLSKMR